MTFPNAFLPPPSFPAPTLTKPLHTPTRPSPRPLPRSCAQPAPRTVTAWLQAAQAGDIPSLTNQIRGGEIPTALVRDANTARTAMHFAAEHGDVACILALFELARGVGGATVHFSHLKEEALRLVNMPDGNGDVPLHLAARRGGADAVHVVEALLRLGARVDAVDGRGRTARVVAEESGSVDVVAVLRRAEVG